MEPREEKAEARERTVEFNNLFLVVLKSKKVGNPKNNKHSAYLPEVQALLIICHRGRVPLGELVRPIGLGLDHKIEAIVQFPVFSMD